MYIGLALIVTIVGLLVYVLSTQAKPAEIGRIMFAMGLLALLLVAGPAITALRL